MTATIWTPGTLVSTVTNPLTPIQFLKGTALLPGITWAGDIDTGMWSQADGYINFTVNGTNVISIDPLGNLTTLANKWVSGVEVDVASATTTDLGTSTSNLVRITGTSNITSFGTNYKGPLFVRFANSLTLSSTAALILPSGLAIQTAAGDSCVVVPKATAGVADGWQVVSYTRASGGSVVAGADLSNSVRIDIASSGVVDLTTPAAANTRNINITGTTTINSFIVPAGSLYFVRFSGALTLTNSASLVTQSGANKTTAAGDTAIFRATAVNTVELLCYSAAAPITIIGSGGQIITGNITLTAASSAAISVTPTAPGLYVTLPVATTLSEGVNNYSIYNAGDFDYGVKDSAGTQLGWVRPRTGAIIGLADNSTSAGVWAPYGLQKTGITAQYFNSTITAQSNSTNQPVVITVDSDRVAFLFGGTTCYVIIYNKTTQTWGTATSVRASIQNGTFTGILASTDLLLVCTCDTTTGMQTVTISLSNVTPTVNTGTKADTTLAGNISASGSGFGKIIAVSTSWVVTYSRDTTTCGVRAITISGTTPTVGSESAPSTSVAGFANLFVSGSVVRTVCKSASTTINCQPYTVSGSGLSDGTAATATTEASATFRAFQNGNGNIVVNYMNSNHAASIFKLTTTVEAVSTAVLSSTSPTTNLNNTEFAVVSASKTAYISHAGSTTWYANILTDTAGTASAGTQITGDLIGSGAGLAKFGVSGNSVRFGYSAGTQHGQLTLDCSGTSPVLSSVVAVVHTSASVQMPIPAATDRYGALNNKSVMLSGANAFLLSGNSAVNDYLFTPNSILRMTPNIYIVAPTSSQAGATAAEKWIANPFATSAIGYAIQRVECAA